MFRLVCFLSVFLVSAAGSAAAAVCPITEIDRCGNDVFGDYALPEEICTDYPYTSCTLPAYLSDPCPEDDTRYKACIEDTARACSEAGYSQTCPDGYVSEVVDSCPYDSSYTKCQCNPCSGYDYTYEQATAEGYVVDGFCLSCGTTKYKRKNNPCTGFLSCDCGGEIGTDTCKSGTVTKYAVCKTCCDNECTEASCPTGYVCRFEACSNKYCITGCAANYFDLDNYWCDGALRCWLK